MIDINIERLRNNLDAVGGIGRTPAGGITRLAGSKEYYEAAEILAARMRAAQLDVRMDSIGNVFGRREGLNPSLPAIMAGSHLDTVIDGGLYDGALGVCAALECAETLNDHGIETVHPLEVVSFDYEEGSELGGTFGSRAMTGAEDVRSPAVRSKLGEYGLSEGDLAACLRSPSGIRAFFELHIEQGAVLDELKIPVGVVDGIVGIVRYRINIRGEANHAGSTPMDRRRDALLAASRLLCRMKELSLRYPAPFVFTVGTFKVFPGAVNVVPGEVEMVLEMRDLSQQNMEAFIRDVESGAKELLPVEAQFSRIIDKPAVKMDASLMRILEESCREGGIPCRTISSGAGHDAKVMAGIVPSAMIFVPSVGGISHNPNEYTAEADIEKGTRVLLDGILRADRMWSGK